MKNLVFFAIAFVALVGFAAVELMPQAEQVVVEAVAVPQAAQVVAADPLPNDAAANRIVEQSGPLQGLNVADVLGGGSNVDRLIGQRITQLPEDGGRWHLSVFTNTDWERRTLDAYVVRVFDSQVDLQWLKAQTHFHHYHPRSRLWSQYQASMTALPCIVVQDAAGRTVYKASGANIPRDPETLAQHIKWMIGDYQPLHASCPCGPRPPVQPLSPTPPTGFPDTPLKVDPSTGKDDYLVAGLLSVVGLAGGVGVAKRRTSTAV